MRLWSVFRLRTAVAELAGARARADSRLYLPISLLPCAPCPPCPCASCACPRALRWPGGARTRACRAAVSSVAPAGRDPFASAELGQVAVGRSPEPGRPSPSLGLHRPKVAVAQLFPRAGPVVIGKLRFQFSFIIWEEKYFGKCLCTHFGSKFVETNFARFLVTRST